MTEPRRTSDRGDSRTLDARTSLLRGEFDAVGPILSEVSGVAKELRVHGVAAFPDIAPSLWRWHKAHPDDPNVHLLSGVRRLDSLAWIASETPQRTREAQHHDEVESLWRAVEHLQFASRHWDADAAVTVWMAGVVGALVWRGAVPVEDFEMCAKAAEELVPTSPTIARWRVLVAADLKVDELAAEAERGWSQGDPRHAEVASAHVVKWLDLVEQDATAAESYWQLENVETSLRTINDRLGEPSGPAAHDASAVMAFVLARTRQPRLALPHFSRLDGRVMTWPWSTLLEPVAGFGELQQRAHARSVKNLLRKFG